jgi:acyl carrier protein
MTELENRLVRCFSSVFHWLTPDEIRNLEAGSSEYWDSLSAVTITAVIQEEFGQEIDPQLLPTLDSFESFRRYLCESQELNGGAGRE